MIKYQDIHQCRLSATPNLAVETVEKGLLIYLYFINTNRHQYPFTPLSPPQCPPWRIMFEPESQGIEELHLLCHLSRVGLQDVNNNIKVHKYKKKRMQKYRKTKK